MQTDGGLPHDGAEASAQAAATLLLARRARGQQQSLQATVAQDLIDQVAHRLRIAAIVAERELVTKYADRSNVSERAIQALLREATVLMEADIRRRLPGDLLLSLIPRLKKETD